VLSSIFRRHEVKFVLSHEQLQPLQKKISEEIPPDTFSKYLVQSLYFDTDNWDVIRASIEKPVYKEKLRLRCYGVPGQDDTIFMELKKKYRGVVYKRRIAFPMEYLLHQTPQDIAKTAASQIGNELEFYLRVHNVSEKVHISYNREAFTLDGLRVTFDTNIRFRTNLLDYEHPEGGLEVLPPGNAVMEVKTLGGMPMWLARILSESCVYPTSFSKYGVSYKKYILI